MVVDDEASLNVRASGRKELIRYDVSEDDQEPPSATNLDKAKTVQVARELGTIQDKFISQGGESLDERGDPFIREARQMRRRRRMPPVAFGGYDGGLLGRRNTVDGGQRRRRSWEASPTKRFETSTIERRRSSLSTELSIWTRTKEHEVRGAVKPAKIVSEPDDEARSSTLDHPTHTTPLIVMDAVDELKSGLSDDGFEHAQDDDDGSLVDGPLCFRRACVHYLIELTPVCKRLL